MTPEEIRNAIKATDGRMFEVVFRKRTTGEIRVLRGRTGQMQARDPEKGLVRVNGKGQSYDPVAKNLLTVREASGGFRNIPLDAVISLRVPDNSKHLVGVAV